MAWTSACVRVILFCVGVSVAQPKICLTALSFETVEHQRFVKMCSVIITWRPTGNVDPIVPNNDAEQLEPLEMKYRRIDETEFWNSVAEQHLPLNIARYITGEIRDIPLTFGQPECHTVNATIVSDMSCLSEGGVEPVVGSSTEEHVVSRTKLDECMEKSVEWYCSLKKGSTGCETGNFECKCSIGGCFIWKVSFRDIPEKPSDENSNSNLAVYIVIGALLVTFWSLVAYILYKRNKNKKLKEAKNKLLMELAVHTTRRMATEESIGTISEPVLSSTSRCREHGLPSNRNCNAIEIMDFEKYVKTAVQSRWLESEYRVLSKSGRTKLHKNGKISRESIRSPTDPERTITVDCIQGFDKTEAYLIIHDSPSATLSNDFWTIIWNKKVEIICSMEDMNNTDDKNSTNNDFPSINQQRVYDVLTIVNIKTEFLPGYTVRTFLLTCYDESREVTHLHYTAWPRGELPPNRLSVVEYLAKLQSLPTGVGPIVFHCCSDDSRAGVIILSDVCWRRAAPDRKVDVFAEATRMFMDRPCILKSFEEYVLVHLILLYGVVGYQTKIICDTEYEKNLLALKRTVPGQLQRLEETEWEEIALRPIVGPTKIIPEYLEKNRFPRLAPAFSSFVRLRRYPPLNYHSNYISAVAVDSWMMKKSYVTTQLPLPSTLTCFWRLILEHNIQVGIILQPPDSADPTCCRIIPINLRIPDLHHVLILKINEYVDPSGDFKREEILLQDTSVDPERDYRVILFTCLAWPVGESGRFYPPAAKTLVNLWETSERHIRKSGPVLVVCHDGLTGCGLYVAMSIMLERMSISQECDVMESVRMLRRSRSEFVRSREQFEYLYDAAIVYLRKFDQYSNFV